MLVGGEACKTEKPAFPIPMGLIGPCSPMIIQPLSKGLCVWETSRIFHTLMSVLKQLFSPHTSPLFQASYESASVFSCASSVLQFAIHSFAWLVIHWFNRSFPQPVDVEEAHSFGACHLLSIHLSKSLSSLSLGVLNSQWGLLEKPSLKGSKD